MPISPWPLKYPFPGAGVHVTRPIDVGAQMPKVWNIDGVMGATSDILVSANSTFQTDNIQVNDLIYIVSALTGAPFASTIHTVLTEIAVRLNDASGPLGLTAGVFKIGLGGQHTLESLTAIVSARGIQPYVRKFSALWTTPPYSNFHSGMTGDVYVI